MEYGTTTAAADETARTAEPQTKTGGKQKLKFGEGEPQKLAEITLDFVIDYCKAEGAESVAWLKSLFNTTKIDKKTKEPRELIFFDVRLEFARKYYPQLATQNNATMKDRIMAL